MIPTNTCNNIMEPKKTNLGSSLIVPSVQELAKEPLSEVPYRYVRTDQEPVVTSCRSSGIPVIDMERLSDSADNELERLHLACKDWGFFQLINHGLSCSLMENLKAKTQEFLNLPMDVKKKYWQHPEDIEGFGQAFVVSEEQKLDWADMFYVVTLPRDIRKPHLFPKLPLPLRDVLEAYSTEVKNLSLNTLMFIAKASKMEVGDMKLFFEDGVQAMRMNYYPPCPQPERVIGLSPHSDPLGITFLLQINEVEGLEIKKDGIWVPIKPLPNSFIVNIGDTLEIVTNGLYKSIEHRAVVNSKKERLSIATFVHAKLDGEIGPAPSLITPETPPRFTRIINHGVSCSLLDRVKKETQEFFKLPMEEKAKFWQTTEDIEGFGQAFVVSEEQKLDWADMFYMVTLPQHIRNPHLFPNLPSSFRHTFEEYSIELKSVALKTLLCIAKALKMETKDMSVLFDEGMQGMRMNYYPHCPQPEQVIGISPHSDAVGITFLLELNEVEGLQIRKDDKWIPVKPLTNAFVVNIGDILEMVTNGQYKSIEHRATVNAHKERLSIATFLSPNLDCEFGPASSLITHETTPKFKRVTVVDYFKNLFSNELKRKTNLEQYYI